MPDRPEQKRKQSRKERKNLGKSPSYMSVTLSDVDGESVQASDGFPFPGMQTPSEHQRPSVQNLSRQGSSPSLGQLHINGSTTGDDLSQPAVPQARRADSSSTLRSHYDSAKVPLPVSQQTSASSARDMALRKGFPPISCPSDFRKIDGAGSIQSTNLHTRNVSGDSKTSAVSKLSGNSIKRINETPRKRPSITDPPTLYPNADRISHTVSPPPALITSTLPKTLSPNTSTNRPKWWQRKTSSPKLSPPLPTEVAQTGDSFGEHFSSIKVNIKKPATGAKMNRNWFDGLEDDEQTFEDLRQSAKPHQPMYEKAEPLNIYEIMAQEARPSQVTSRKSSFSNKSQHAKPSDRKLSFRLDSSPGSPNIDSSSPPNAPKSIFSSPRSQSGQTTASSKSPRTEKDLQVDSFLELSSSDDEAAGGNAPYEAPALNQPQTSEGRGIYRKQSSAVNAQRTESIQPRSGLHRNISRPLSKRSTSSEYVPPVPRIPDRPKLTERTSSTRWREFMEERAASTESTVDSGASSFTENANVRRPHSSRTRKKSGIRASRLMKVTSEEEKLLEAMRDKRASIRQDDFEKGFKTAMQLQDIVTRPKTAGADGRTSRSSTVYGSRSSMSPPPQEYNIRRQLAGSRLSASADDLLLEEAYPFPDVPLRGPHEGSLVRERMPPSLKSPLGFASPSKTSPSLSFGPSDILLSTPTSRDSPLTPPPGHSATSYVRSSTLSPSRGIMAIKKLGHDRKRTVSSSVVMLDGVEERAQQLADEQWAMDHW